MKCPNCGLDNDHGASFCHECGVRLPQTAVAAFAGAAGEESAPRDRGQKPPLEYQDPALLDARHPLVRFLSIIMALLLFFSLSAASIFWLARALTRDPYVERYYEALDLPTARLGIAGRGEDSEESLSHFLWRKASAPLGSAFPLREAGVAELLGEAEAEAFFKQKTKDYISELFDGTNRGRVSPAEVVTLLKACPESAFSLFGFAPSDADYDLLQSQMAYMGMLDSLAMPSLIGRALPEAQFALSVFGLQCLAALCVALAALLFFLNRYNRAAVLKYAGVPLLVIGILGFLGFGLLIPLSQLASMRARFDFLMAFIDVAALDALLFYAKILAAGAVMIALYNAIHKFRSSALRRQKKKAGKRMAASS